MPVQTKKSKKKVVWIVLAVLILVLIAVYNLLLSSYMMTTVWLPMAEQKSGYKIDAAGLSVSLFSTPTVAAKDLKVSKADELEAEIGKLRLDANPLSFLFSKRLEVANLEIVKLRVQYAPFAAKAPSAAFEQESAPAKKEKKAEKDGGGIELAVKKVNIYDADLTYTGLDGGQYELSGFSFSAADFMQGASPSVKFSSFVAVNSKSLKVARTKLEGGLDLRLPADTLIPDFVKMSLELGKTTITHNGSTMEIGLSSSLNMTKNGDLISLADSKLLVTGHDSGYLVKGLADGSFDLGNSSGKLKLSFNTYRSELADVLASALSGSPVKGLEVEASLSAEVASGMSAVSADGKFSVQADQMVEGIRSVNSTFALRAAKNGDMISVSQFDLSLREGSGKLNLNVLLPEKIELLKTASGFDLKRGQAIVRTDNLNLPAVADMFGQKDRVPLKSGLLSALFKVKFGESAQLWAVDGSVSVRNLLTTLGDKAAAPADLNTAFTLTQNKEQQISASGKLTGTTGGKEMVFLNYGARIPVKGEGDWKASVSNLSVNPQILSVLPFRSVDSFGIRTFLLTGNAEWTRNSAKHQLVSSALALANLTTVKNTVPLTFHFSAETSLSSAGIEFRKFLLNALEKEDQFFDLGMSGVYVYDASRSEQKNDLTFTSSFIDAKKIQDIARNFKADTGKAGAVAGKPVAAKPGKAAASAAPAAKQEAQEPAPMELARYNGVVKFMFAKIRYTDDLFLSLSGPVVIENNQVRIDNLNVTANDSPVSLRFKIDTGVAGGYPYDGAFSMTNLALPPLLKAAMDGDDHGVTGTISSVRLNFTGKGVTPRNLKQNLNGSVTASTKDLSFPAKSAEAIEALDLLMIPLAAVPGLTDALSSESMPEDLKTLRTNVTDILEGRKNVEFKQGSMNIAASKGVVSLKQFQFEGGTLKKESVTGTVNLLSGALNLDSALDLGVLIIPMPIKGTLSKPEPDYKKFLVDFTKQNIKNALKPDNIENTIKNVDGIINMFKKKKK